jgi:hypothetical protein
VTSPLPAGAARSAAAEQDAVLTLAEELLPPVPVPNADRDPQPASASTMTDEVGTTTVHPAVLSSQAGDGYCADNTFVGTISGQGAATPAGVLTDGGPGLYLAAVLAAFVAAPDAGKVRTSGFGVPARRPLR